VDPGRRYQGGEPCEELVGLEEQEERAATGALHPVDELAALALREPLKREWRSDRVAAAPLQAFAVALEDADARVEREAAMIPRPRPLVIRRIWPGSETESATMDDGSP
jgi:hypothetical protein